MALNQVLITHTTVHPSLGQRLISQGPPIHTTVHSSLGQRLIREGWEVSLSNVGLSKFVLVGRRSILAHPKANNT